jgi:hypothetical protein
MSVEGYEVGERSDKRGVDLISDVLPFGSPVVWRVKRSQQRGWLREVSQVDHIALWFAFTIPLP